MAVTSTEPDGFMALCYMSEAPEGLTGSGSDLKHLR